LFRLLEIRTGLAAGKSTGQILMIYGVAAIGIMGVTGLAVDGGYIFAQRRLVQNGADAGALVGARDIVKGNFPSVDSDVTTYARGNAGSTANVSWEYVDNAGAPVGQSSATGVSVLVTKTFNTFFIQALGISTFTVSSRGAARAQVLQGATGAPFIVCAGGLTRSLTGFPGGILTSTIPPTVRPEAIYVPGGGPEFVVHGSKVGQSDPWGDCNWSSSSSFKGNTPPSVYSGCASLPCYYPYATGNSAGPSRNRVAGLPGCNAADENVPDGCVAILPIAAMKDTAADTCAGPEPSEHMCVVAWAPFQLRVGGQAGDPGGCNASNCHIGRILDRVISTEGSGVNWTPGTLGPMVVRLLG
jgi:Flp pilus assembly protein TadG